MSIEYLNKAEQNGGVNESSVLTNLGIVGFGMEICARILFNKFVPPH